MNNKKLSPWNLKNKIIIIIIIIRKKRAGVSVKFARKVYVKRAL